MASPSPSSSEERLSIGSTLDGRYRIDGLVGIGGMGSVYRCEHVGIGRPVAIKVLHADFIGNREASVRFQREAIASGRLEHPNIVGVSDFGLLEDGGCYLVMELLEGESLGDRLDRERLPWREAIDILRGVLRGLRHAHDRGVVHRDIKPDNVFLAVKDGDPITKILDFGIAKLFAGGADDPGATRVGITVGTPAYLSPEQAVGGEITPASDLYSTTVLLFEMLTGRPPFEDKDPLSMLGAHVGRPPPSIAEIAPELVLPPELEKIIQQGLAKQPLERFPSANEYLAALAPLMPLMPQHARSGKVGNASGSVSALPFDNDSTMVMNTQGALVAVGAVEAAAAAAAFSMMPIEEPIPKSWMTSSAALLGALTVIALVVSIAGWGEKAKPVAAVHELPKREALEAWRAEREGLLDDALDTVDSVRECKLREEALAKVQKINDELPFSDDKTIERLRLVLTKLQLGNNMCLDKKLQPAITKLEGQTKQKKAAPAATSAPGTATTKQSPASTQ
jgi:Protein kinase domain